MKVYVNGKEAWMLRDTGCTTVCISKKFAGQINSKNQQETECLCHEVEVDLDSPYISGNITALTIDCPFTDVIFGESAFIRQDRRSHNIENCCKMKPEGRTDKNNMSDRCLPICQIEVRKNRYNQRQQFFLFKSPLALQKPGI